MHFTNVRSEAYFKIIVKSKEKIRKKRFLTEWYPILSVSGMNDVIFIVKAAKDLDKKTVIIPAVLGQSLGIRDFAIIIGQGRSTVVQVKLSNTNDFISRGGVTTSTIEVDTYTMNLLRLEEGSRVEIFPATVRPAESITIAPSKKLSENDKIVIPGALKGKVLTVGDVIPITLPEAGKTLLSVEEISPRMDGVLFVSTTKIRFLRPRKRIDNLIIDVSFDDIGDYDEIKDKLRRFVITPLLHPGAYKGTGFTPSKGIIISGPRGSGKTMLVKAIVFETDVNLVYAHASDILSDSYFDSKQALESLFAEAKKKSPAILCIEDIDEIAPRRMEESYDVEKKLTSVLITLMDTLDTPGVMVIGTTSNPDRIDPALLRAGRFDKEIEIPVPDVKARLNILKVLTRDLPLYVEFERNAVEQALKKLSDKYESANTIRAKLSVVMRPSDIEELLENVDGELYKAVKDELLNDMLLNIAKKTHGFVGADLEALVREAIMVAINRLIEAGFVTDEGLLSKEGVRKLSITEYDFEEALKVVEPSALKEILIEVPEVHWDDIGGYDEVKQLLKEVIEWPLNYPELFDATGINPPKGVLLYGPPGTGKTLLAKAVATESGANFIAVKGPEVLSKWVGEGERKIREIFRKARQVAPTIIFFDEIDSIGQRRGSDKMQHVDSMINQLLTEMDGLEEKGKVVVIAATNRPDILDPALLRPGRFDRLILIPAPDEKARLEILKVHTKNVPLASDVKLKELAKKTEGYSGADLEALVREATIEAIRRVIDDIKEGMPPEVIREKVKVTAKDFEKAMKKVTPSITKSMISYYESMEKNLKSRVSSKFADEYGKFW